MILDELVYVFWESLVVNPMDVSEKKDFYIYTIVN